MRETSIGGSQRRFADTLWSVVLRAKEGWRDALDRLIQAYWKPVYFYLRRRSFSVEDAKDLTQEFFAAFVEKDFLSSVDRSKGKFKSFVLAALNHFLSHDHEKRLAKKRYALTVEAEEQDLASSTETPERAFERQWVLAVLHGALENLEREANPKHVEALRAHLGGASYADIGAKLGAAESDVRNYLHRVRRRFRELLSEEVRQYVADARDFREELRALGNFL